MHPPERSLGVLLKHHHVAVDQALHITNGTLVLSDRPAIPFDSLTWSDHGCDDHCERSRFSHGSEQCQGRIGGAALRLLQR